MSKHRRSLIDSSMQALTVDDLDRESEAYDRAVLAAVGIDCFCSSSDWVVPAARALMPGREPWINRLDADTYITLMRGQHGSGWKYAEALEALWGLASPIIGPDPAAAAEAFDELLASHAELWDVMVLSGVLVDSELEAKVRPKLDARYEVMQTAVTTRHIASLEGGLDGWLGRRSRQFRKSLRKCDARCTAVGIEWEHVRLEPGEDGDALYDRVLEVERRGWKGRAGFGIDTGAWSGFYRHMVRRLVARHAQRTIFARHQDRDVGYVLGGMFAGAYRGLQMSYDVEYRDLGLGNVGQLRQIEQLCEEGIEAYDMGTGMEYKVRWAEHVIESPVLLVVKT